VDDELSSRLEDVPGRSGTFTRVLATLFVVCAIAFWLFAFSPWARDIFQAPDQIADETYVSALDGRCAAARSLLLELPLAQNATSPVERASALSEANDILTEMANDLAGIDGGTDNDRRLVGLWLEDWDIYQLRNPRRRISRSLRSLLELLRNSAVRVGEANLRNAKRSPSQISGSGSMFRPRSSRRSRVGYPRPALESE